MNPLDALKRADEALKRQVEEKNRLKNEKDRQYIMDAVAQSLPGLMTPLLERVSENSRIASDEILSALQSVKIEQPTVDVKVETPKAEVTVKNEPITIPAIDVSGIESAIERGIARAKFPKPEVTVNTPEITIPAVEMPEPFDGEVTLKGVDRKSPLPVMMMGADGKPFQMAQSAGGGRGDFYTIKDIQNSTGGSLIDNDGFLKVTGSFSVSASGSTTVSLVNTDGLYYNSDNPLPVTGSFTSSPGLQISGAVDSVNVVDAFGSTAVSGVWNADNRLRVSLETGGSGLTDAELRASSVPVSQVSGVAFSVSVNDVFGSTGTNVINPDGRLKVELPTGSSGLTDTELRASHLDVQQVSGSTDSVNVVSTVGLTDTQLRASTVDVKQVSGSSDSVNVLSMPAVVVTSITNTIGANIIDSSGVAYSTSNPFPIDDAGGSLTIDGSVSVSDVFGSVGTNVINPDGRIKVELPTGSSGLTDTELRASSVPVSQVSGVGFSTNVTDIFGSTITTGVLNGDNRIRVSVETGGSGLTDSELRASHLDVQQLSGTIDSVYVTGVAASFFAEVTNPDNRLRVELPTGSSGLTDTELRASHLDVQQVSGAIDSVFITGASGTLAANIVDSSGVGYSGSNPFPVTFSAAGFQNVAMYDANQSAITSHFDATGDFRGLDNANIRTVNFESILNSSATTLGISGVFTGLAEDIKDYSVISLSVFADQASATDGLSIQQSSNGTNWDIVKTFTITASQGKLISVQAGARYFRIVYTNGGVAQTNFRMMPIFKQGNQKGSSQRTADASSNEEDLEQVWSFNSGYNGTTWDRVSVNNGAATTAQRVVHATDAVASTNIAAQGVTLDVRQLSGASFSVNVLAGTITTVTTVSTLTGITQSAALFKSRQTNPTAIANDWVSPAADDLGRLTTRPVQVRDLIRTAYVSVANGTETTLLAATAGTFSDLIKIMLSNNSTAAVGVDVRAVTGGNITHHFEIPANGVVGESLTVPWPQDATGNNWTVDLPDITGTTVTVSALFTQEI